VVTWEAYPYNPEAEEAEAHQDREVFQAYFGGIQPAIEEERSLDSIHTPPATTHPPHPAPAAYEEDEL